MNRDLETARILVLTQKERLYLPETVACLCRHLEGAIVCVPSLSPMAVVYVHPREVDSKYPRLPLNPVRRFRSYVNLDSTLNKLRWICKNGFCCHMKEYVDQILRSQVQQKNGREGIRK